MADFLFHHLGATARGTAEPMGDALLTQRQHQILRLIHEGLSNKEIAQRLALGVSTVKNHVHALLSRLNVTRRAEAAAKLDRPFLHHMDRRQNLDHFSVHLTLPARAARQPNDIAG
jgi:DNA-binding NarL/FixJ family response regulator